MTIKPPAPVEERSSYVGYIKSFNVQKGWGHIECDETFGTYGKDIFLLRSQLNGVVPDKGDKVYFSLTEGKHGVEATGVHIESSSGSDALTTQGYIGTVKSWNPVKGWGHIICDTTEKIYGKDIFVMRSAVRDGMLQAGEQVSFHVTDGLKGPEAAGVVRLQAAFKAAPAPVQPAYAQPAYAAPMYAPPAYAPTAYAPPMQAWSAAPAGRFAAPVSVAHFPGQVYYGTIKSYDEQKGWGHIACDVTRNLYKKDMFVLKSALKNQVVQAGDQVRFCIVNGQKGPEASDVVVVTGVPGSSDSGAPGSWASNSTVYDGTVKSYNAEKGWGHIDCPEARAVYGKDIFLHQKQLNGQVPTAGSPISFSVVIEEDGRSTAINVALGNESSFLPTKGTWVTPSRASPY